MARHSSKVVNQLRDVDDIVKLVTGRRIPYLVARGLELFGEDILNHKAEKPAPQPVINPAYAVLGVRPEAAGIVVKASFRCLAREFHPDTGLRPDAKKFQEIKEAYDSIEKERHSPTAKSQ